ncbi:MAG: hypothetical protein R2684_11935 [Pyrinomonadaceae bacterium]
MYLKKTTAIVVLAASLFVACDKNPLAAKEVTAIELRDVPSQNLSYRYEGDVPAPPPEQMTGLVRFERSEPIQNDFDVNRPTEILERTIASPNKERLLAIWRKGDDLVSDFRLDMYGKDGKLIRHITHEEMAVQFPDTIRWSPDGSTLAYVAKVRNADPNSLDLPDEKKKEDEEPKVVAEADKETPEATPSPDASATPADNKEADKNVLTFRTEQIYICDAEGGGVKPLTQVEGLMYFYFAWAPDSSALAALAAVHTEWKYFETRAKEDGQMFLPRGRPRLIEKNGRERRLDDLATAVHPVWSPDSAKVAVAFDKQVRIYDGVRPQPTQAAIPLRNELLLSAREYEKKLAGGGGGDSNSNTANADSNAPKPTPAPMVNQPESAIPDANLLSSFNPIVEMVWPENKILYFQTGFVRNYVDETQNARSFMRWHRLILSSQPIQVAPQQQAK